MAELGTSLPEELREQQQAMGAVLRAVASGQGLQPVLDEVAAASMRLCRANTSSLYVLDGGLLHAVARAGGDFSTWEYDQAHPHELDRTTVVGRAVLARGPAHIPDVLDDAEYTYGGPRVGYRSLLGVPIVFEGEVIGGMTLTRPAPEPFTDEDIELVQTFADQAAIAIKNARLLETVERQLSQQRAVSGVMRSVARAHGLQGVLDDICESAASLTGVANGRLFLLKGDLLHAVAYYGSDENFEHEREHPHAIDRSSMTGRAALTAQPVHLPDVLEDPEYTYAEKVDFTYRSGVTVPIFLEEELIGALGVVSPQPNAFTEEHIELLQTFADQAAIAIANARLIDATNRQLDQQRAIADVVRAIALAEGLEAVLQGVIDAAKRLCHSDFGALYLAEGGVFRVATKHEGEPELDEFERDHHHVVDRTTAIGRAALSRDIVHIPDVRADPEYAWGGLEVAEYRTVLATPIVVEGELIGAMDVTRQQARPFSEDEIELLRTFADQAAIAIANARLIDATERQLEQQSAIADVLGVVARGEGLEAVFDIVLTTAGRLCAAEYGQICLAEGDVFRVIGTYGTSPELEAYERAHPTPLGRETTVGRVGLTREVVHIPDVLEDPEYAWGAGELHKYRAMLGVPIFVEDELIGVINVVRDEPGPFSGEHIELVKTFADQAAIAIANARLIDAVERQRTELSRFVSPQVAELISSDDGEKMLAGHRAYVSVLFCDLRGFTAFSETAAPEELFEVLGEYHRAMGELVPRYQGTLEHFAGDGLMVFFNDPLPVEQHELQAVRFAVSAQECFAELAAAWRKRGIDLGLGIGIASGYATLGRIGFEGRYDYGALGPVSNLASRLSSAAQPGQTLIAQRLYAALEDEVDAEELGELDLKGFGRPVVAYALRSVVQSAG